MQAARHVPMALRSAGLIVPEPSMTIYKGVGAIHQKTGVGMEGESIRKIDVGCDNQPRCRSGVWRRGAKEAGRC